MPAVLYAAFRLCCGCCLPATETDATTPRDQQVPETCQSIDAPQTISPTKLRVPVDVKSPPERRCSIPLHRKRLGASPSFSEGDGRGSDEEGRRSGPYQLTASDIEEELDDDDDDDDCED